MEDQNSNTQSRKVVDLKYIIDDEDVKEIAVCLTDGYKLRTKRQRSKKIVEEDNDRHDELEILMDQVIPEEYMEHATNKLSEVLLDDEEKNQFGFQTPRKKQGMTLKAQESASKYHSTPSKNVTPVKSKSGLSDKNSDVLNTPTLTLPRKTGRRSSIIFGGEMPATPSKGNILTPTKSALKYSWKNPEEVPKTPSSKSIKENDECTPNKQLKGIHSNEDHTTRTPSRRQSMAPRMECIEEDTLSNQKTPYKLRQRAKACIRKAISKVQGDNSDSEVSAEDFSSDSEDDYKPLEKESSEEDILSDDEENVASPVNCKNSAQTLVEKKDQVAITPSRSRRKEVNYEFATDAYFETFASKDVTSNNTLSRLRNPRLREDTLQDLLKNSDIDHKKPLKKLTDEHRTLFQRWLYTLSEEFNILLYGVGSKRHLLQDLHDEVLCDSQVLVVNGFFPGLTIKEILDTILSGVLGVAVPPANPLEAVELIEKIQSGRHADTLYLLIHNLDGPSLKNNKAQTILSKLAKIKLVRLIASIDHINAPLMWDQAKLSRYNFAWWDVTTFVPYTAETSFESSLLIQQTGALQLSSLHSVFKSLTKNGKQIYLMIARHQLENAKNQAYTGFPFNDLYWAARNAFVVSSQMALRAQLNEFLDHHMLKMKRGGEESLIIPIDNAIVEQFVQSQEEKQD